MFVSVYSDLVGDPTVSALVGTPPRIYPHGRVPPKTVYPYVVFSSYGTPENTLSEVPLVDNTRIQVDCYATNQGGGQPSISLVAKAVRDALERVYSMLSFTEHNGPDPVTGSYRATLEFQGFNHREVQT